MMDISSLFQNAALPLVLLAAALDVTANMLLVRSDSFRRRAVGLLALALVGLAFYCLSLAVHHMDLAVAYAMWGGFGVADGCCCAKSSTPAHLRALPCLSAAWCCYTRADVGPDSCFQENV